MRNHQMTLISDFYKQAHAEQYPKGMSFIASYFTPRMSRLNGENKLIVTGIQGFNKDYLIERFNDTFFNVPLEQILKEYNRVIRSTLTKNYCEPQKIENLHKLGYLPIEIKALKEGTRCPIKVPCLEITSTRVGFEWVVQFIESVMSCQLWYPMTVANQAYKYRTIVNKYYDKTVEDSVPRHSAISEFGFRGAEGQEGAVLASTAFLTSFTKTATIPAILYLEDYYNGNLEDGSIGKGMLSTEHSVMCSNYAIDGSEDVFVKRILSEIYPSENISMVSDSYDYWNMVDMLSSGKIKAIIQARKGTLFVRGDSGDPIDIICGTFGKHGEVLLELDIKSDEIDGYFRSREKDIYTLDEERTFYVLVEGKYYKVTCYYEVVEDGENAINGYTFSNTGKIDIEEFVMTSEMKGTVQRMWEGFGGTINSKGYKVLQEVIRAVYGDSITPFRTEEIYKRLALKGFAANNVALGAGSFSMHCAEEDGQLKPFTRDTYGIAIKATYMEINGTPVEVFKNPKTDTGNFKKSQKGMCYVHYDENGEIIVTDGYTRETLPKEGNLLETVFKDGKIYNETSIYEVRDRLHAGTF